MFFWFVFQEEIQTGTVSFFFSPSFEAPCIQHWGQTRHGREASLGLKQHWGQVPWVTNACTCVCVSWPVPWVTNAWG